MDRLPADKRFKRLHFLSTVIPENITISEAPMQARPVMLYDSGAAGTEAFRALATEVLARLDR
jgi:chromosome partitioning protein